MIPSLQQIIAILTGIVLSLQSAVAGLPAKSQVAQVAQTGSGVEFTVNNKGINYLAYNGMVFLNSNVETFYSYLTYKNSLGEVYVNKSVLGEGIGQPLSRTLDADSKGVLNTYNWGKIHTKYSAEGNKMNIKIEITNQSTSTIRDIHLRPIDLKFPSKPDQYDGSNPMGGNNMARPTVIYLSYAGGTAAIVNEDVSKPLSVYLPWRLDSANTHFPLIVNTGFQASYPTSFPWIDREIPPGATDVFEISIRFGAPGMTANDLAGDIYQKYSQVFPQRLNWEDKRPILRDFIAEHTKATVNNPRGYMWDNTININTEDGRANLRTKLLARADKDISLAKSVNAQGFIIWDLEGQEFPHAFTYVGAPNLLPTMAPEMNAIADEFFKKFTDAGLKVGVTLRPDKFGLGTNPPTNCQYAEGNKKEVYVDTDATYGQKFMYCNSSGTWSVATGWNWHQDAKDFNEAAQILIDKITYAKNRWGATLFYVDSNSSTDASVFEKVYEAHPDVLVMPEHESSRHHAVSAPYNELRGGWAHISANTLLSYPKALSVIAIGDTSDTVFTERFNDLVNGVKNGNLILMGNGWYGNSDLTRIKKVYDNIAGVSSSTPTTTPTPTPTPVFTPTLTNADLNGDGVVNSIDYSILSRKLNQISNISAIDVNKDGIIDSKDYLIIKSYWFRK